MTQSLYRISSKRIPSIWDSGTEYEKINECEKCGAVPSKIITMGAYFPSYKKAFGIVRALNGFVVSEEGLQYLINNDIDDFHVGNVNIRFAKRNNVEDKYHWIRPKYDVEIDNKVGAVVCDKCGCGIWSEEDWEIHKVKDGIPANIFRIKYTWVDLSTEHFKKVVKDIPGGCFLDFEKWSDY